jgi:branched-chain amino acid transport system permease protein
MTATLTTGATGGARRPRRVARRSQLFTSYAHDQALLNSRAKAVAALVLVVVAGYLPLAVADDMLRVLSTGLVLAVGAIGLNLLIGYAGQVSLGHAFFAAVGAYTAAVISGEPGGRTYGLGITEVIVWLPAAGLAAALCGAVVAPLATRLRGLYLAVVTLGLVFIGQYLFAGWQQLSGGPGVGREAAEPVVLGHDLGVAGAYTADQKLYWLALVVLLVLAVPARNLARSKVGRAFAAVRDRDIAAGMMGISLFGTKLLAFTLSAFYAGVAGSLLFVASGHFDQDQFGLMLSIQFITMVLIGGAGTISGSILGALLVAVLPRITTELSGLLGFISTSPADHPNVFELEQVLYGALIIAFLLLEPRGLFGLWTRLRTYWTSFPFSH